MILKAHKTADGRKLLCITDSSLIGRRFEDSERQLDFTGGFYRGEERDGESILKSIRSAYLIIFSGKDAVEFGTKSGIIEKGNVLVVDGIPQVQCLVG